MSAISHLQITLEHDIDEQYQYQPGEIVRGRISADVTRPTFVSAILVAIKGEGTAAWDDEMDGTPCQASETYIDSSKVIVDTKGSKPLSLGKGRHDFEFEYQLPENLPSSYIGKYGSVTYILKATVQGVKSADTQISSEPFLVLRQAPLPASVTEPVQRETSKRILGFCNLGTISASCRLDKSGGMPGEDIIVQAEVQNRTGRTVTAMQASLMMTSTYTAQSRKAQFKQMVNRKRDEFELGYKEGRRWNFVRLTIPPYIPESKLEFCDIIDIAYAFQFRVELAGGGEMKMEAPLLIGSKPQGLEIPRQQPQGRRVNLDWSRGEVPPADYDAEDVGASQEGGQPGGFSAWNSVPPELRTSESVITNPLYRQESVVQNPRKHRGGGGGGGGNVGAAYEMDQPEVMENTRL